MTMCIEPSLFEKFDVQPLQNQGDMPLPPNVLLVSASFKSTKSLWVWTPRSTSCFALTSIVLDLLGCKFIPLAFYKPNVNEFITLKSEHIFHCILYIFLLWVCFRIKNLRQKRLICYKTNSGSLAKKKHVEEHVDIAHTYFNKVAQWCYALVKLFEKQSSKIFTIATLSSISQFFSATSL
jgi:hypothetical protein